MAEIRDVMWGDQLIISKRLTANLLQTNNIINQQEQTRQSNEADRLLSESNRDSSEITRDINETSRIADETTRQNNEATRQDYYNAYKVLVNYNSSTSYIIGNKVTYQGGTYQCIQNTIGSSPTYNTDNTWWKCISAKGTDGSGGDMFKSTYDPSNKNTDAFNSSNHVYNNSISGLTSTNAKAAIDELKSQIGDLNDLTEPNADLVGAVNDVNTQLATTSKLTIYEFGTEYLYYYHEKLRNKQAVKLIFSGDSTTYGDAITDTNWVLNNAAKNILVQYGVKAITSINSGHSGKNTQDWLAGYLADDLAQTPDLYILRWGVNDSGGLPLTQTKIDAFETRLRTGLATIRASYTPNQMSILLMSPNSTNDTHGGRDAEWYEAILPLIRKAARDYYCGFLDTYSYLRDSANVVWQDNPYGDGRHIHPLNTGNAWIIGLMSNMLMPVSLRNYGVSNVHSDIVIASVNSLPSHFPEGVSLYRAVDFPYNGSIVNLYQNDGIILQFNYSYTSAQCAFRTGFIGTDTWSFWIGIGQNESWISPTLQNSWVNYENGHANVGYFKDNNNIVHLKGWIKSGSVGYASPMFTLPQYYRPSEAFEQICMSNNTVGILQITSGGDVALAVGSSVSASLDGITFRAEQ
jgi:lysophospholipase L1-like esterase